MADAINKVQTNTLKKNSSLSPFPSLRLLRGYSSSSFSRVALMVVFFEPHMFEV